MNHKVKHEMTVALSDEAKNVVTFLRDIARGIERFGELVDRLLRTISIAIVCGFIIVLRAELMLLVQWIVGPHTIDFWVPVCCIGFVALIIWFCYWLDQRG